MRELLERTRRCLLLSPCLLAVICTGGCCLGTHYEAARLYRPGYTPGFSPSLHTNGFYSRIGGHWQPGVEERFKDHLFPVFFYPDGTFCFGMSYPNVETLRSAVRDAWVCWGFYSINGADMRIETVDYASELCRTEVHEWEAILEGDELVVRKVHDAATGRELPSFEGRYKFQQFDAQPNPARNWIKTNPHYRL
jgi:hypothetical protein